MAVALLQAVGQRAGLDVVAETEWCVKHQMVAVGLWAGAVATCLQAVLGAAAVADLYAGFDVPPAGVLPGLHMAT